MPPIKFGYLYTVIDLCMDAQSFRTTANKRKEYIILVAAPSPKNMGDRGSFF